MSRMFDNYYFDSGEYLKLPQANIHKVLNHERRHAKGYVFRYEGGDFI